MFAKPVGIACACIALLAAGASAQPAPYTFDVILPLTGPAAFVGKTDAQTFAVFEKYANASGGLRGQPIHFDVHDDQSSPQVAVQLANDVIARGPAVFFGSGVIATCASIATLTVAKGPVQYCLSPGLSPARGSYVFATASSAASINAGMLNYMRMSGAHGFAILAETEATGLEVTRTIHSLLQRPENRSLQLLSEQHFNPGDLAVTAQAAVIKASGAQFVLVLGSGPGFAAALHGLADAGVHEPVMTTANNMVKDQLKMYAGFLPADLFFNGFPYQAGTLRNGAIRDRVAAFATGFKQSGIEPGGLHVLTWDAPLIVLSALRQLGPAATAEQLRAYLENLHDFAGINGVYDFRSGDQHGLGADAVVIVRWDPQKEDVVPVSDLGGRPLRR